MKRQSTVCGRAELLDLRGSSSYRFACDVAILVASRIVGGIGPTRTAAAGWDRELAVFVLLDIARILMLCSRTQQRGWTATSG